MLRPGAAFFYEIKDAGEKSANGYTYRKILRAVDVLYSIWACLFNCVNIDTVVFVFSFNCVYSGTPIK
jgi:S-methylmethionine-dependent homocysteine/selenocysteine methylase